MVNGGIVQAVQHQDQVLDNLLSDLLFLHYKINVYKACNICQLCLTSLEENPLSLLWQAIDVGEFLEEIDLPMMEGFLKEVQEPFPPPRTPSPLFFQPQSN